jgi:predicted HicB family RNase H-like nuclease
MKAGVVMRRKTPKRIIFNVENETHKTIKMRALKQSITIREWILLAIMAQIHREQIEEI